jgi:o-succinylbenzoate synthase
MAIEKIQLYELTLPLVEPFIISGGTMTHRRSLVVVLYDGEGHEGWGESPPFELPFYSEETLAGARYLLEHVLIPRLLNAGVDRPHAADPVLRQGVRGNRFARAALDTAFWDLEADRKGIGLAQVLGHHLELAPAAEIDCGVALGIPSDRSVETLRRWIERSLSHGYRRVKIKVAPEWDAAPTEAARSVLRGTDVPLTVDANGAYDWPYHEPNLRRLDEQGLLYIEQPLAPDELLGHARLLQYLHTPICLDETLHDAVAAKQLVELCGPRVWNIKVHRVGGLTEVCRIYQHARDYGAELWAGTMPESGIGSQAALAAAALPGFCYPSDLEPSSRWFGTGMDVIDLKMSAKGRMTVPTRSIAQLLNRDRFDAASRLLTVTRAR